MENTEMAEMVLRNAINLVGWKGETLAARQWFAVKVAVSLFDLDIDELPDAAGFVKAHAKADDLDAVCDAIIGYLNSTEFFE
jgi:hypothetical protein